MLYNIERPINFDQMVGQELIVENLRNQSKAGKFFPVLILSGQYGSGKTTMALVVAMAANCQHKDENGNPCGRCESCRAVLTHAPEGAIEIDGATNNGVDHVRKLLEKAATLNIYKKKVIIIDEAHMMSKAAFNAMLVTLENPPEHCIFIVCTTEAEALPLTITSRMPVYTFGKIPDVLIKGHVLKVAERNQINISSDAAGLISRYANGAMRNALQILEQLSKQKGGEEPIEAQDVVLTLGLSSIEQQADFLSGCLMGDIRAVIETLKTCERGGVSIKTFLKDVLTMNTDLLLVKSGAEVIGTDFYLARLKALCSCSNADIVRASRILTAAVSGNKGQTTMEGVVTEIAAAFYGQEHVAADGLESRENVRKPSMEQAKVTEKPVMETEKSHISNEKGPSNTEKQEAEATHKGFENLRMEDENPFEKSDIKEKSSFSMSGLFSGLFAGLNKGDMNIQKEMRQDFGRLEADKKSESSEDKSAAWAQEEDSTGITECQREEEKYLSASMEEEKAGDTLEAPSRNTEDVHKAKNEESVPSHGNKRISWKEMAENGILPAEVSIPEPDSEEFLEESYAAMEQKRREEEEKACSGSFRDLENARKTLAKMLEDPGFKMLYKKARCEEKEYRIFLYYDKAGLVEAMNMYLSEIEGITALLEK